MFVDKVKVFVSAGDGGNGHLSFRHEKFVDRGGPDGGDGGNGGDVIAVASDNEDSLAKYRYSKNIVAEAGKPGSKRKKHGKAGLDFIVKLPVGSIITRDEEIIADLTVSGQEVVIARGGRGGFGNAHFVSSIRQAPRIAEIGEPGDSFEAVIELKSIADVGIIGLPNAGKSTFLSVVSNAKPEIADYPFTTLVPNLGVVDIPESGSLLMADIPGLIEGASEGKGLGGEFLRHVERTKVLLHLIDAYESDVVKAYKTVVAELAAYSKTLGKRDQLVVLTKIEGLDDEIVADQLVRLRGTVPKSVSVLAMSSTSGQGVKEVLYELKRMSEKAAKKRAKSKKQPDIPVIRPDFEEESWKVTKTDEGFMVTGRKIEKFAVRTRFDDDFSLRRIRDIMHKMGIWRELKRQGIKDGDHITIGRSGSTGFDF